MNDDEDIPVRDVPPENGDGPHDESGHETPPGGSGRAKEPAEDPLADLKALADGARSLAGMVNERFVEPIVRGYPEIADHLATAGAELAAAFRTVLRGQEQQWNAEPDPERITITPSESTESTGAPESVPVDREDSGEDDE